MSSVCNQVTRLKVEDALSYLDRVKQQFSSNPGIYNEFLDIMKKFKAQSIDTPGVINQVSQLFSGHPELMVGFNAFLPMGYKVPGSKSEGNSYVPEQKSGGIMSAFEPQHQRQSPRALGDSVMDTSVGTDLEMGRLGGMSGSQPMEFNHAINYVNKIKMRYQHKPEVYKTFLDILHVYQNEQKQQKEYSTVSGSKSISESEVFRQVSVLFKDDPDLLKEFSQFLPDATASSSFMAGVNLVAPSSSFTLVEPENLSTLCGSTGTRKTSTSTPMSAKPSSSSMKTTGRRRLSSTGSTAPVPARRFKPDTGREATSDYYNLFDFALFDKIHKALGDADYFKFLKVLNLYSIPEMHMSTAELMQLIQPFTAAMPDIKKLIRDMLKQKDDPQQELTSTQSHNKDRMMSEQNAAFDYASCKVVGQSYRTLPRDQVQAVCSGRTELCRQVLNDVYVSCPSWSEDSSSVIKKLGAEEQIFRCEEDRFQFDVVIANFESAMHAVNFIIRKLNSLGEEDIPKRYTESLFAMFPESLFRIVIRRLYASEAPQVLEAMKKNPLVVLPIVLTRLETKAEEWTKAKERNSKTWNELNQKYYLKSLDHQGVNFKQTDMKQLRSKALIQELTSIYDERVSKKLPLSPNMELLYEGEQCMRDASSLIIHHVKRQTSIHQDEKQKIKQLLKHFIPDLFFFPRGDLSDDEPNEGMDLDTSRQIVSQKLETAADAMIRRENENRAFLASLAQSDENMTSLLFGNLYWYLFIRLFLILCDRLHQFHMHSERAIVESQRERKKGETSVAVSLGYRAPPLVEPEKYYSYFLDMVKSYLDGNLETATYEEQLRELFTINAYVAYTMDKLIQAIVRQLQNLVSDAVAIQLMELCNFERSAGLVSDYGLRTFTRMNESSYQHRVEQILPGEHFYRIAVLKKSNRVTIDYIPMKNEGNAEEMERPNSAWNKYIEQFSNGDEPVSADCLRHMKEFPFFVRRHLQHNRTQRVVARIESTMKLSSDETSSTAEASVCQFYVDRIKMVYATNPNSFFYKSAARFSTLDQKLKKFERVGQKRIERFTLALGHIKMLPNDRNWFLRRGMRKSITLFPHSTFCSNCCNQ